MALNQQVCQDEAGHLGEGDEQHPGGDGCSHQVVLDGPHQIALHGHHQIAPCLTFYELKAHKTVKCRLQTIETNAFYIL